MEFRHNNTSQGATWRAGLSLSPLLSAETDVGSCWWMVLERQGGDVHRSLRFCECSSYTYEDVKTVVDVLQRAVLGKAREIH